MHVDIKCIAFIEFDGIKRLKMMKKSNEKFTVFQWREGEREREMRWDVSRWWFNQLTTIWLVKVPMECVHWYAAWHKWYFHFEAVFLCAIVLNLWFCFLFLRGRAREQDLEFVYDSFSRSILFVCAKFIDSLARAYFVNGQKKQFSIFVSIKLIVSRGKIPRMKISKCVDQLFSWRFSCEKCIKILWRRRRKRERKYKNELKRGKQNYWEKISH